jgi:hypothetical protein
VSGRDRAAAFDPTTMRRAMGDGQLDFGIGGENDLKRARLHGERWAARDTKVPTDTLVQ